MNSVFPSPLVKLRLTTSMDATRGQVVGQRVNRLQVSVLVVEPSNVRERQAPDRVHVSSAVRWVRTCRAC